MKTCYEREIFSSVVFFVVASFYVTHHGVDTNQLNSKSKMFTFWNLLSVRLSDICINIFIHIVQGKLKKFNSIVSIRTVSPIIFILLLMFFYYLFILFCCTNFNLCHSISLSLILGSHCFLSLSLARASVV